MSGVTLYHPTTGNARVFSERRAVVKRREGWTTARPAAAASRHSDTTVNMGYSEVAGYMPDVDDDDEKEG